VKKDKTILIIDDSSTTLLLLEWSLTQEGYDTQIAQSVEEARKMIEQKKPDLILLDLFMPRVSGYDFLKMRPELNIKEIPVIIVSAYDNTESIKLVKDLGADEFIAKPFMIPHILDILDKYLE
jgi:DNA-binding response OmpR family regulator